ncbi:MAG TPA: hypothetical protein PLU22_09530 [Polyangiaceae bacterium]|nr:hypothetical protein [Polyangiaceae bacterium]
MGEALAALGVSPALLGKFPAGARHDYAARTVQWLGQRLVSLVVGAFALMGFCLVPLGDRTALGHLAALGRTEAAQRFAQGLVTGLRSAAGELEAATGEGAEPPPLPRTAEPRSAVPRPGEPAPRAPAAPRRPPPANASLWPAAVEAEPLLCLSPSGAAAALPVTAASAAPLAAPPPTAATGALRPDG